MNYKDFPVVQITIKNAIELKCGECCGFDWTSVIECPSYLCPIHSCRPKGRKDKLKAKFWDEDKGQFLARAKVKKRTGREMSEEEKKAAGERMRKIRNQNA